MNTMTLAEAIEEVKRNHFDVDFTEDDVSREWRDRPDRAIATILNAVVKGELKYVGS